MDQIQPYLAQPNQIQIHYITKYKPKPLHRDLCKIVKSKHRPEKEKTDHIFKLRPEACILSQTIQHFVYCSMGFFFPASFIDPIP